MGLWSGKVDRLLSGNGPDLEMVSFQTQIYHRPSHLPTSRVSSRLACLARPCSPKRFDPIPLGVIDRWMPGAFQRNSGRG